MSPKSGLCTDHAPHSEPGAQTPLFLSRFRNVLFSFKPPPPSLFLLHPRVFPLFVFERSPSPPPAVAHSPRLKSFILPFTTHATPPPPSPPLPASMPPTSPRLHRHRRSLFDTHAPARTFPLFCLHFLPSPSLSPRLCRRRAAPCLARRQRHQCSPRRRRCLPRDRKHLKAPGE